MIVNIRLNPFCNPPLIYYQIWNKSTFLVDIISQIHNIRYSVYARTHKLLYYPYYLFKEGGDALNVKEATTKRIVELCKERTIAYNRLANQCGITPSTIYSIFDSKKGHKTITISTIKKICDGLDISLKQFFDSPMFDNLDDED